MEKVFLNYPDWRDTADTLHMFLQLIGKVKLERCDKRPEWAHARLFLTIDGLTTGIIPGDKAPFEIALNIRKHQMWFRNLKGRNTFIPLKDGLTVASFYRQMMRALEYIGSPTTVNIRPQEFYDPVEFDKDEKHHSYKEEAVLIFFNNLHFAHKVMKKYLSPFRGKIDFPAYYFGTMDLSCTLYSGEPAPFPTNGIISSHAFDERDCEFGFWPGDNNYPKPAFFILPYPFISNIKGNDNILEPSKAIFTAGKNEFFLTLEDAFSYQDPEEAVIRFFRSSLEIVQKINPWKNYNWITTPLTYQK